MATDLKTRRELLRLVNVGLPIAGAAKKVGISESTARRWIQRLRTGSDSQQQYEERQRTRALGGRTLRKASLSDVNWIEEHLWWTAMAVDAPPHAAEAATVRMTPAVVAELEKRAAAEDFALTFERDTHHAPLDELALELS